MSGSSALHTKEHYDYPRKMTTPTHPTEGDFIPLPTEEAIFCVLFAWMGYWAFKQIRAMFAYHRELRALAGDTGSVGVTIGDGGGVATIEEEEEEEEEQPDEEDEDYAFIQHPVANDGAQKKTD